MLSLLRLFVQVGVLVSVIEVCLVGAEDCLTASRIGDPRRDPNNAFRQYDYPLCDAYRNRNVWYRFDIGSGLSKISESFVGVFHCGTFAPIWMNGSHPTASNPGPVMRTVCAQFWFGGDRCVWSGQVNVKWCRNSTNQQEYYIYQLKPPPPVCSTAYCVTTASTTSTTQSWCSGDCSRNDVISGCSCPKYPRMTTSVLSQPYVSDSQQVTGIDGRSITVTKFSVRCTVGYPKQGTDDGARFRIHFQSSNGAYISTVTVSSTDPTAVLDESFIRGRMGNSFSCSVSSYWQSASPVLSTELSSNSVFIGIIPVDDRGNQINRIDITEQQEYKFWMMATFPITSEDCFYQPRQPCEAKYTFSISANDQILMKDCSFYFTPSKTVSDAITIRPVQSIGVKVTPFNWYLDFEKQRNYSNTIYYDYKIQSIPVQIVDLTPRPMCSSTGDPHILTFGTQVRPSIRFNVYLLGDYVLVNSSKRVLEIQVRQFPCNGNAVTCNCGVMVREGNNILGVDSCPRSSNVNDWTPRIIQTLSEQATHGATISETGSGWTINLISGIQVNVDRGWTTGVLDVHVIGIAIEASNYDGLCSYNGSQNSECTTDCEKYRVPDGKSFFEYRLQDLPQCEAANYTAPTCSCKGRNPDNSIGVECLPVFQVFPILGPFFSCKIPNGRRKRSTPVQLANNINFESLYNSYYHTLRLANRQPYIENNRDVAKQKCNDALKSSAIYQTCNQLQNLDVTPLIENCATDYQFFGDSRVTNAIRTQLERLCVYTIERSINESSNGNDTNTIALRQKLQDVKSKICPQECSRQGNCTNGACQCNSGYTGSDCSLKQGQSPVITNVLSGICDLSTKSCQKIYLEAKNISSAASLSCRFRSNSGRISYDYSPVVSGGVVICSFPSSPTAGTYYVSLSNDGSNYSNENRFDICNSSDGPCVSPPTASTLTPTISATSTRISTSTTTTPTPTTIRTSTLTTTTPTTIRTSTLTTTTPTSTRISTLTTTTPTTIRTSTSTTTTPTNFASTSTSSIINSIRTTTLPYYIRPTTTRLTSTASNPNIRTTRLRPTTTLPYRWRR